MTRMGALRQANSLDELYADPVGRWLAGRSFLYWCATPALFGFSLWGRPDQQDMEALAQALRVTIQQWQNSAR